MKRGLVISFKILLDNKKEKNSSFFLISTDIAVRPQSTKNKISIFEHRINYKYTLDALDEIILRNSFGAWPEQEEVAYLNESSINNFTHSTIKGGGPREREREKEVEVALVEN